jgi:succinate dehydrogenase/fumarate reductase flavoprotein subunit
METNSVSRRAFLKAAGVSPFLVSAVPAAVLFQGSTANAQQRSMQEADVLVVGSGAAGSTAALIASVAGSDVIVLETGAAPGGTTAKSGAGYWIPNNHRMRERGVRDDKQQCLAFMARLSYPTLYQPNARQFGLPNDLYGLLDAFYDNAAPAIDVLRAHGVGDLEPQRSSVVAAPGGDSYPEIAEHSKTIVGRLLQPTDATGSRRGGGALLVEQFQSALALRGVRTLLQHRVTRLGVNARGDVAGLEAVNAGRTVVFRARKGVVFGTGGFIMNPELCRSYLKGPVFGGCAASTNNGDLVHLAGSLGAKLGNMSSAWWAGVIVEQALQSRSVPSAVFTIPGDSILLVNCEGRRCTDEKSQTQERTPSHFAWDPTRLRFPNLIQVAVFDERCREMFAGPAETSLIPPKGVSAPHLLTAQTLDELAVRVDTRLAQIVDRTGNFRLDPEFASRLAATVARFNEHAKAGVDPDFERGRTAGRRPGAAPNPAMYPLASTGPYYAVLVGAGTRDTNGGPVINAKAQIVRLDGTPIPGLYGAGNCIASPVGQGDWGAGGTLGPAITFGAIAGKYAAAEPVKEL